MHRGLAGAVSALILLTATSAEAQEPKQGGRMTVTYKDDVSTLDPAIGYDWQNWSMIKSLFDGLMDYRPGTTELVPDLAEKYELSADGQAYTFILRQGVKFHNGRELTSADIKYSIERVLDPKTQSPGAGFFGSIASIDTPDPRTVVFKLNRPDATFLHVMAINFAFAVPKEEAEKFGPDFGKNPVGTGAFRMREWTLGQRLVLERNPGYYKAGLPRLDEITFEIGQEPLVALLRFERGEVDILGDQIPPAKFLEVRNNPDLKDNLVVGGQLHTGYVTMNVNVPPFDKKEVRQAVNYAINKDRIIRIINNRGVPANQPLPPSMPGYATDYQGYTFDPAKAKELLAAAGQGSGFDTELLAFNTDPNPRIAQAIQQDLAGVGIRAELKALAQANVIQAGGEKTSAQMIWSGGMGWIADFPDPSNFYGPILSCSAAADGGWGWSKYCNQDLDQKAAQADAITDPAKQEERLKLWREVFLSVMDDAPWAPVFNEQRFTLKSDRLGGEDALFVDPVHIPVHYDEVWAKDAP
jgi:ABC-type transport system substrate-binding protein